MDQDLINKLWIHTKKANELSVTRSNNAQTSGKDSNILTFPIFLPTSDFFNSTSSSLFMSFHNSESNSYEHYHDFFEILYICKGNPIGIIDKQEIQFEVGNICIMNPKAIHYFQKYLEDTDLILNIVLPKELFQKSIFRILFSDKTLSTFFIRYQIENSSSPSFMFLNTHDSEIDQLIEILIKEYLNKENHSCLIVESLLTLIFSYLIRSYKVSHNNKVSSISNITDYIYLNYQTTDLESTARHFNYHPKYLSSMIHKHTGQTYRELLINIKLQSSINYLLYQKCTIEQIAEIVGYKDKSSFYSQFKKAYHMSPVEYREKNT